MFDSTLFPSLDEKKEVVTVPAASAAGAVPAPAPAPIDSALLKQGWINHLDKYPEQKEVWEYKTIPDDHSSLTMKFCCHLAFYTQKDADLMREIFEASPFAKCSNVANKWNDSSHILHGQQYADYHIQKAIAGCTDVYNPALSKAVVSTTDIVPRNKFPDVKLNQDGKPTAKPLATIENIKFLLDFYKIFVVNNVINKVTTITGTDIPNETQVDNPMESALGLIYSRCNLNGLPTGNIDLFLTNIASQNQTNPVVEYMESLPTWDGTDYIQILAIGIKSYSSAKQDKLTYKLLTMWLIQCVAAADYAVKTANTKAMAKFEYVLVFIGDQGINKTAWFNALFPPELKQYFKDGLSLDPNNKDSREQATAFWIVELGELDATFRRSDISALKAFLSERQDTYRKSYAKTAGTYKRRTAFCASVNDYTFLKDGTGNRRYWPIYVMSLTLLENLGITHDQLWPQVRHLYLNGEQWWPTPTLELELNEYRDDFSDNDREAELEAMILDYFEDFTEANKLAAQTNQSKADAIDHQIYPQMTSTEIIAAIERGLIKHSKSDINLIGKIMRKINTKLDGSPDLGRGKKWRMPRKR